MSLSAEIILDVLSQTQLDFINRPKSDAVLFGCIRLITGRQRSNCGVRLLRLHLVRYGFSLLLLCRQSTQQVRGLEGKNSTVSFNSCNAGSCSKNSERIESKDEPIVAPDSFTALDFGNGACGEHRY